MSATETVEATVEQVGPLEHKRDLAMLGMWIFLASEIMFFGGLFLGYAVYRGTYPAAFAAGSSHLNTTLGSLNTAILLISSIMMALAVNAAQTNRRRGLIVCLICTAAL